MRKLSVVMGVLVMILTLGSVVLADQIEGEPEIGDRIVTLATGLTEEQKAELLIEFGLIENYTVNSEGEVGYELPEDVHLIEVDISEEKEYLGSFIGADKIGSKSISSSFIEVKEEGYGVDIALNNITWVDSTMYRNALITSGVTDVTVKVSSPFNVSGTGALTGLIKAYDEYEDIEITEEQKMASNEEMVLTLDLGEEFGKDQANELMIRLKELIANRKFKSTEDLREAIQGVVDEMGLDIDEATLDKLTGMMDKLRGLDIDWGKFGDQVDKLKEEALGIFDNIKDMDIEEKATGFWEVIVDFFKNIGNFFSNLFGDK